MKIRLKVPRFEQKRQTCGQSSLQQVLAYYGRHVALQDIVKGTRFSAAYGTWMPYLAMYAAKLGFDVKIIVYDFSIFDPSWLRLSRKELVRKLRRRMAAIKPKGMLRHGYESLIDYLKGSYTIEYKMPSEKLLLNYLNKKIPPIIALSYNVLHGVKRRKKGKEDDIAGFPTGHFVVVSGQENGNFIITDPSVKHGGILKISKDKLLYAWFCYGGWLLVIEPKGRWI